MERLEFTDFKVSIKSTNVPNTIAANRLLSERIPYPLHLGITEAGTKWSGSLKSAVGLGTLLADGIGDTIRISSEHLPRRGGGQGRLGDPEGAEAARARPGADRLPDLRPPAVRHGHGGGRHRAPARGLRGPGRGRRARLRGQRHRRGVARRLRHHRRQERGPDLLARQGAQEGAEEQLVDELFKEIDKYTATKKIEVDATEQAEGAEWLQRIEEENAGELTPERLAKLEAEKQRADDDAMDAALLRLDESDSPTAGRRFTRA